MTPLFNLNTTKGQSIFLIVVVAIAILPQYIPKENVRDKINDLIELPQWEKIKDIGQLALNYFDEQECAIREHPEPQHSTISEKKPTYWLYSLIDADMHLNHVDIVLDRVGYVKGDNESDWDLLWSHPYPYLYIPSYLKNLKSYQRVNHFPGLNNITNKVDLSTSGHKFMAKAFRLPEDEKHLKEYAAKKPDTQFCQKHNQHRGISIKKIDEINFDNRNSFVQEYLDKPLLIGGHKFDIGMYTIITSVNPLRVYTYAADSLFRYCPEKYHPFDSEIVDKYVVSANHKQTWEVEALRPYYEDLGYSFKATFDGYLRANGKNPDLIWAQIDDIIRYTFYSREKDIIEGVSIFF